MSREHKSYAVIRYKCKFEDVCIFGFDMEWFKSLQCLMELASEYRTKDSLEYEVVSKLNKCMNILACNLEDICKHLNTYHHSPRMKSNYLYKTFKKGHELHTETMSCIIESTTNTKNTGYKWLTADLLGVNGYLLDILYLIKRITRWNMDATDAFYDCVH